MNVQTKKEIRQLMPMAVLAIFLAWLPWVVFAITRQSISVIVLDVMSSMSAILLGVAAYGSEINSGTMSLLLSQPVDRRKIWNQKGWLLGLVAAIVILAPFLIDSVTLLFNHNTTDNGSSSDILSWGSWMLRTVIILATGICGGLWATLFFKNVAVAFSMAVILPLALVMPLSIAESCFHWKLNEASVGLSLLTVYSIVTFVWARKLLLNMQDTVWTGGNITFAFDSCWIFAPLRWLPRGPKFSLMIKEVKLHQVAYLMASFLMVLHGGSIILRRVAPPQNNSILGVLLDGIFVLWIIVPVLIGSISVAEERRFNTLESSLCLPVGRKTQFFIKIGVALALGIILGGVLPILLEYAGVCCGIRVNDVQRHLAPMCTVAAVVTLIFFYASTMTRGVLQAFGTGIGFLVVGYIEFSLLLALYGYGVSQTELVGFFSMILVAVVAVWMIWKNFSQIRVGSAIVWRNFTILMVTQMVAVSAAIAVQYRTWEWVMTLEPEHGPTLLAGSVRPQIANGYLEIPMVLLPDGRLWAPTKLMTRNILSYDTKVGAFVERIPAIPVSGHFIGSSNWTHIAMEPHQCVGRQKDGSLWKLTWDSPQFQQFLATNRITGGAALFRDVPPAVLDVAEIKITRLGQDSDWKSVVSVEYAYLAMKNDGSLWGWGRNLHGLLGEEKKTEFQEQPSKLEIGSDWLSVFKAGGACLGVKTNGTVWGWGRLRMLVDTNTGKIHYTEDRDYQSSPALFPMKGTNWSEFGCLDYRMYYGLDATGTVLGIGGTYGSLLDHKPIWPSRKSLFNLTDEPVWKMIADKNGGIKLDGSLYLNLRARPGRYWGREFVATEASSHRDWIAITHRFDGYIALAADGTLCQWAGYDWLTTRDWVFPSRKPDWSLNILKNGSDAVAK